MGDRPGQSAFADERCKLVALSFRELLGVGEPCDGAGWIEDDGGGAYGARERAPPCFVHAADEDDSLIDFFSPLPSP
jgi:hypothetical protein